ncbi:hypothetical protein F4777DRAFT_168395 [Nemania sp. FL0916]|nr:hypothetical protein F4777DRAFT_168395 [Nemania sp. FL0916]
MPDKPAAEEAGSSSGTGVTARANPAIPLANPVQPGKATHVDLKDPFYMSPKSSAWTNDPTQLDLDIWFDPQKPNIGNQYGIRNLRPVIKEPEFEDYLLMDANGRFYTWNPNNGVLFRVKQHPLEPKDAAVLMMNGFGDQDVEQMFNMAHVKGRG